MYTRLSKAFFILILLISSGGTLFAQQADQENSLLWKVQGNGIETSYLFGTFHILPQSEFEIKKKVSKAFKKTNQLVLELDMDDPSMQMEMMKYTTMTDGTTLDQLMSPEDYELLDAKLKNSLGLGVEMFKSFKPFVITTMLYTDFIEGTPASFEMTLMEMAKEKEMEILGLETIKFQMAIFDQIPYQDQVDDITDMLNDHQSAVALFAKMIEVYKSEDLDEMGSLMADYFDSEDEAQLLLGNRNRDWIAKIGEMAKEEKTFFAVGAGHLGGDEGVIRLLKAAGYKVTPIN